MAVEMAKLTNLLKNETLEGFMTSREPIYLTVISCFIVRMAAKRPSYDVGLLLEGKDINLKMQNMWTTSFSCSIRGNQYCINLKSRLGSPASFVPNQLQKYNIRDFVQTLRAGSLLLTWNAWLHGLYNQRPNKGRGGL